MNLKKCILLSMIVFGLLISQVQVNAQSITFPDVPKSHWAYDSIYKLVDLGYVKGYNDGNFGINDSVTRAQAATILVRWLKDSGKLSEKENLENTFTDITTTYFAYEDILLLVDAGYMQGKGNNTFEPNATVTRAEMATILVNILGMEKLSEHKFDDVSDTFWGSESIKAAYSQGLVKGIGNNQYNPSGLVSRAEFSQFVINALEWTTKGIIPTQEMLEGNIQYPYKSDYVDIYNLFREDVVVPETDELWEEMMLNQYFEKLISSEGQEIIAVANQKYQTEYQFTILNRSLQIADAPDGTGFISLLSYPNNLGDDGYRLIFNSKKAVEVEMAQRLLRLFDEDMYNAIKDDLQMMLTDATNSTGKYANNTEDERIVRFDVPGYHKIKLEIFYKTKGIWIYVDPDKE